MSSIKQRMKYLASLLFLIFSITVLNAQTTTTKSSDQSTIENSLTKLILVKDQPVEKYSIAERMAHHKVPGVSIVVVRNGKIDWAQGYGYANTNTNTKVNENTLFQAGSISKPVAALAALKLAQEGKLDLDENVNTYLKDWSIEDNELTANNKVTVRRLLTHTAGTTVHGFPGYMTNEDIPSDIMVLDGKGNTPKVYVDVEPESMWRYSGGGYTIMEKVVEDISGESFQDYMKNHILSNMDMRNSTYNQPLDSELHANASAAYDTNGNIIEGLWHNYPEQAAAGLWTTPTDLAKYCIEIQNIRQGKSDGVLSKKTVDMMLTKHKNDWGLGPSLRWEADSLVFSHGGKNAGFTNNMVAFAERGDAVIVMTNADNGGRLMSEIITTVSQHYGWNLGEPRVVETKEMTADELSKYTGRYQLDFQVPGIGDYIITLKVKDNGLLIEDPNDSDSFILPLSDSTFMDIENGDTAVFDLTEGNEGFRWNNQYQLNKLKD